MTTHSNLATIGCQTVERPHQQMSRSTARSMMLRPRTTNLPCWPTHSWTRCSILRRQKTSLRSPCLNLNPNPSPIQNPIPSQILNPILNQILNQILNPILNQIPFRLAPPGTVSSQRLRLRHHSPQHRAHRVARAG
ncbi:MAG: hypothetical protein RLZZ246_360 [Planctomycetota bacterium]